MQIRTAFFAALATLPLLAGAASAHGNWGDGRGQSGYSQSGGYDQDWRQREAQHNWAMAERSREWAWQRHRMWEARRYEPPRGYHQGGGYGPRW